MVTKAVLECAKPLAARDPHVPTLDLIPQGGQHGTFIGAAIGGAIGPDKGPEPFGNTGERQVLREGTVAGGIEVTEELDSLQEGGGAGRLQGHREVGEEAGCQLAEVTIAFHHEGKDLTGVTGQPVVGVLELTLQALRRNVLKHRRADRVRRHLLIEQRLANGVEALEGGTEYGVVPLHHRIEVVLGAAVCGRHYLAIHVDELIERVPVGLQEETDQDRISLRRGEPAQAMRTGLPDVLGEGFLEIGIEPREIEGQGQGGLDLIQFRDQPQECPWRGQAWQRLECVQGGVRGLLDLQEGIEADGHLGRQAGKHPHIELLASLRALLPDHARERRAGGYEDTAVPKKRFGLGDERGCRLQT